MQSNLIRAGNRLAEIMPSQVGAEATITRIGTINTVYDTGVYWTADVDMSGGTLMVETYAKVAIVTGILARPGCGCSPLFEWSSTWSGTPGTEPESGYLEKTATVTCGGLILCEVAAAISGTGEYSMAFDFLDANGERKAYWCSTSPQKNGGTLRWVASGSVRLPYGSYTVKLTTFHWGTVSIVGNDSSGNSLRWRDASLGVEGVSRYARLRMA